MQSNNFEKQTGRDKFFKIMEKELLDITDSNTGRIKKVLLEEIACPLCGSHDHLELFKKQGFKFVRCKECSIVFVNPRIKESELVKTYTSESEAERVWKDIMLSQAQIKFNNKNFGDILDEIQKHKKQGKLVDIGCSFGHFLDLARNRGFEVEGLELENEAVKYARDKYGLEIKQRVLAESGYNSESFDVAAILGVLEHVAKPLEFLKEINKILKPGGILAITTPNVESLMCMILKERARAFTGRNHLTYFSASTLQKALSKSGFKILWIESYVSGLNSIINDLQHLDPFEDVSYDNLPKEFCDFLKDDKKRKELDKKICDFGLGYKLRLIAKRE